MTSVGHRLGGIAAGVATAALATAAACTVFNGLAVTSSLPDALPPVDSSTDVAMVDAPFDAPVESGAPPQSYLTTQQGAQLCALATSCQLLPSTIQLSVGVPIDGNNFSLCMEWATGPIPGTRQGFTLQQAVLQCMAQATSCVTASACAVFENIAPTDPRCASPGDGGGYCLDDGSTTINCSTGYAEHCANGGYSPGTSCNLGSDGLTACSLGPHEAGCPADISCIGTFEDYCGQDGLHIRYNCATFGDPCVYAEAGAQCGEACPTVGSLVCAGNVVKSCDGIEVSPFNCADMGGTCSSKQNAIYCARPGDTCTPLDPDINVCSGTTLSLCVGGQKTTIDCASISKQCLPGLVPQTPHCG
jgi:hypothetical protein